MISLRNKSEERPHVTKRRKWWLPPLLGLVALVMVGFAARAAYHRWAPARLAKQAHALIEKGDHRGAALLLNQAVHINPESDEATRQMADLMESLRQPAALEWRRRLAEINPGSRPEALAWARLALRRDQPSMAQQALDTVPEPQRGDAEYQSIAGMAAIHSGKWKDALQHFNEACRLDPKNDMYRYNLAVAQLQSPDKEQQAVALKSLVELGGAGKVSVFARRAAVGELMRQGKLEEALVQSTPLFESPDALISDRVTHVQLLQKLNRPEAKDALHKASTFARQQAADAGPMINWFRLSGQPAEALAWADKLDPSIAKDPLVQAARAECLLVLGRWSELQATTAGMEWKGNNPRRMALLSKAQRELGDKSSAEISWSTAVRLSGTERGQLSRLAAAASDWGWKLPMRDALWAAVEGPSPQWALRTLHESYLNDGDTAGIMRVARRMSAVDPHDLRSQNNAVQCALLLGVDLPQTLLAAQQLLKDSPEDPVVISTYSFALLANGMPEEALATIEKISPEKLRQPSIALYYALALRANGDLAKAREFAALAAEAKLLPEEKVLLKTAQS